MSIVIPKFFWPLAITASNKTFKVDIGGGTVTITITEATYLSAVTFAAALQTALQTVNINFTCSFSVSTGILTIYYTAPWTYIGSGSTLGPPVGLFNVNQIATLVAGSYNVTGSFQHANGWYPTTPPREDSLPIRDRQMNVVTRAVSGQTKFLIETELSNREWEFAWLAPEYTYKDFEGSTSNKNKAIERLWEDGYAKFRYFPARTSESNPIDYVLDLKTIQLFRPERQFIRKALYRVKLTAWAYVS